MTEKRTAGIGLSKDDKDTLHKIARTTIESRVAHKKSPAFTIDSQKLKEKRGAFVSLHLHGNLRGCIGYIHATKPLCEIIKEMAIAAAFEDPRFDPLTRAELKGLDIEISVLTPLQKIKDVQEIQVGKHGLYITKQFSTGLLLPQVATQYGWDRQAFLEHTCTKAGLPTGAWQEKDTEIYIFSADIF